ncbi:hypothetical protein N7456_005839 [Penicillium angulare]|uniref:Rhodopsin domain-containing protein n=1 Tax=Penicillium angulare TaxID=116970 RepID=A0A9W9FZ52_9EURO|nr:hypothetical protein N7456_005839 [Penicillium angulare]
MSSVPTKSDILWMEEHINDTRVPGIIICCAVCAASSVIVLALRIWSRLQTVRKLVFNDYLFIGSVIFYITFCAIFASSVRYGAGKQIILIMYKPAKLRMLAILNILNPIFYGMATALVKWSILALYVSIFPQKIFRLWSHFVAVVNILNALAIVLVGCLQCRPLEALWDSSISGTCIDFGNFSLFNTCFNLVLDLVILVSPLGLVMKLNMSRRKRVLLGLNFALGGAACVVASIRIPYAHLVGGTSNPSWDMIPGGLLCVVEVAVAILCSSIPTYRPLLKRISKGNSSGDSMDRGYSAGSHLGSRSAQMNTRISSSGRHLAHRGGINITENISMKTQTFKNGHCTLDDD